MAKFKFDGTIEVHGVKTANEAINILLVALDDYESMNPGGPTIIIHHDQPQIIRRPQKKAARIPTIEECFKDGKGLEREKAL